MNRIKDLRILRDVSIVQLARSVGIPAENLIRLENGHVETIDNEVWDEIARFFRVPVAYLMGITDDWESAEQRMAYLART